MNKPLVSICCTTYNHEKYIEDALEGFLMQKTNFPLEILIHDDASEDNTQDIIRQYEKKYSDLIKPIYQKENQYSKGIKPSSFNYKRSQGKYIAFCEGDDFWTDSTKLQKQVDFLNNNKNIMICGHAVNQIDEKGLILQKSKYNIYENIFLSQNEIVNGDIIFPTLSIVFRNNVKIPMFKVLNGDLLLFSYLANYGNGYIFKDVMGTHRFHKFGVWSSLNTHQRIEALIRSQSEIPSYICVERKSIAYYRFISYSLRKDPDKMRKVKNIIISFFWLIIYLRKNSLDYLIRKLLKSNERT